MKAVTNFDQQECRVEEYFGKGGEMLAKDRTRDFAVSWELR
jgi:hypothetical protein